MLRRRALLFVSLVAAAPTGPCRAESALATAAVDYSLYREGEVRRSESHYGGWLLTCDVIRRLGEKFCSLRAVARSSDGTIVAAVTVSTDERGRPAAILTITFGTSLTNGVSLSFPPPLGRSRKPTLLTLRPVQCGGLGCQIVWSIGPDDIRELRAGRPLSLSFRMSSRGPGFAALEIPPQTRTVSGTLEASGFSDALEASLH